MGEDEVLLRAGSLVVRVGNSVRRPAQPWTASVARLLRHLQKAGYDAAPRSLGIDELGREVVTYLPSEPTWPYTEEVLVAVAHRSAASTTPSQPSRLLVTRCGLSRAAGRWGSALGTTTSGP